MNLDTILEIGRFALGVAFVLATIAVWYGVWLERDSAPPEVQHRGWLILLRGLAAETAIGFFLFAADTSIGLRQTEQIARANKDATDLVNSFGGLHQFVEAQEAKNEQALNEIREQTRDIGRARDEAVKSAASAVKVVAAATNALRKQKAELETLRTEAGRLQADSLSLQAVLAPRHIGIFGLDRAAPADTYFAGIERFKGTSVLIQTVPGDREAINLASEIALVLSRRGWTARVISELESHVPSVFIGEGVSVLYPTGKPYSAQEPNQPWFVWHDAAETLATALTKAGLGVSKLPVSVSGFDPENPNTPPQLRRFNPAGVYVQVGSQPIGLTLQMMDQQRGGHPDAGPLAAPIPAR